MSKAYKCDRCFKCFDPKDVVGGRDFTYIAEVYTHDGNSYEDHTYRSKDMDIHLCPDCSDIFWKFMDMSEIRDDETSDEINEEWIPDDEEAVDKAIEDIEKFSKGVLLGYILAGGDCHCAHTYIGEDGGNADKGTTGGVSEGDGKAPKRASRAKKVGE